MTIGLLVAGSPAIVTDPNHGPRRVVVERVGWKYLYVKGARDGFDRETGQQNDGFGNSKLWTLDQYNRHCDVESARRELWNFGIRVERSISDTVLLEIREALITIVPRQSPSNSTATKEGI
jgi:hypothetical protein